VKKLQLNLEDLSVDQFQVEANTQKAKGTVVAHASTAWYTAPCLYCANEPLTFSCGC
jgi:hypothetical protein